MGHYKSYALPFGMYEFQCQGEEHYLKSSEAKMYVCHHVVSMFFFAATSPRNLGLLLAAGAFVRAPSRQLVRCESGVVTSLRLKFFPMLKGRREDEKRIL